MHGCQDMQANPDLAVGRAVESKPYGSGASDLVAENRRAVAIRLVYVVAQREGSLFAVPGFIILFVGKLEEA